ncbi:S-layer homology domain-containing protein [Patescibacteria group bacterium]|nr:S-layer homology domain-containing protein [Patescibacteria group bacterium]
MKKFIILFSSFILSFLAISIAFATTAAPVVDEPTSPVNSNIAVISGTATPGASVKVTGGMYNIAPVTANANGHFEVTVALVQETTNHFSVTAQISGDTISPAVTVEIVEGAQAAIDYETSTGIDRTAPSKPVIENTDAETDQSKYTITGTGEANATLIVTGDDTKTATIDSEGNFEVEVDVMCAPNPDNTYNLSVKDAAGNQSSSQKVYVTSTKTCNDVDSDDDDDSNAVFPDIENHWSESYVTELYAMGAVGGYQDGTFRPENSISRAEILKIALETFGHDVSGSAQDYPFSDVGAADWPKDYVEYAFDHGFVEGYSDGTFRPNDPVTRAAALKIIIETTEQIDVMAVTPNFPDVDSANDWYAMYTSWALTNNIVSGYADGEFKGGQNISRAEASKIIIEVLHYLDASA